MTIEKIRMFIAVCVYGTVSKAADSLFISQPAISQGVKELEKELGVPLFAKQGRHLVLTKNGEDFLPLANSVIESHSNALNFFKATRPRQLIIGCTVTIATYMLPQLIEAFEKETTSSVKIIVDNVAAIKQLLADNKIDVGFIEGLSKAADTLYFPLNLFELVFVASPTYLDNASRKITEHQFLVREKGSSYRLMFDDFYLLQTNSNVQPKWTSFSNEALKQAALHDQGVALLPQISVSEELAKNELEIVALDVDTPIEYNGLIVNKYRAGETLIKEFINFVQQKF